MPIVSISLSAGRDPAALRSCLRAVHEAVRVSLGVADGPVRVLLAKVPPQLWTSGGVTLEEREAGQS